MVRSTPDATVSTRGASRVRTPSRSPDPRRAAGTPGPGSRRPRGTAARRGASPAPTTRTRRRRRRATGVANSAGRRRTTATTPRTTASMRQWGRSAGRPVVAAAAVSGSVVLTGAHGSGARGPGGRMVRSPAVVSRRSQSPPVIVACECCPIGVARWMLLDGRWRIGKLGKAHLRDRWRGIEPRQGAHVLLARAAAQGPGPAGHDAEARPVHQRRPGHDEPLPARRGVRHRRRRRDRSRPRALRAVRRRVALDGARTPPPGRSTRTCSPRSAGATTSGTPCR